MFAFRFLGRTVGFERMRSFLLQSFFLVNSSHFMRGFLLAPKGYISILDLLARGRKGIGLSVLSVCAEEKHGAEMEIIMYFMFEY